MKKFTTLLLLVASSTYAFSFKKFFSEDLKYNAFLGYGQVEIVEDNTFDSDLKFTYINYGGGISYKLTQRYTLSANISLKNFTELEYSQNNQSGKISVDSTYSDLFFAVSRKWDDFLISVGYDNLNYFVGAEVDVIEPVRVDRARLGAKWYGLDKYYFHPSAKIGVFIPVSDDVSGFDISISGSYQIPKHTNLTVDAYFYKAILTANDNDSDSTAYGLGLGYSF